MSAALEILFSLLIALGAVTVSNGEVVTDLSSFDSTQSSYISNIINDSANSSYIKNNFDSLSSQASKISNSPNFDANSALNSALLLTGVNLAHAAKSGELDDIALDILWKDINLFLPVGASIQAAELFYDWIQKKQNAVHQTSSGVYTCNIDGATANISLYPIGNGYYGVEVRYVYDDLSVRYAHFAGIYDPDNVYLFEPTFTIDFGILYMHYNAFQGGVLTPLSANIGSVSAPSIDDVLEAETTSDPIGEVIIDGVSYPINPDGSITIDGQTIPLNSDLTYTLPDGQVVTPSFDLSRYPDEAIQELADSIVEYIQNYYSIVNEDSPSVAFDPTSIINAIRDHAAVVEAGNTSIISRLGDVLEAVNNISLIDKSIFDISKWGDLVAKLQQKIGWVQLSKFVYTIGNDVFGVRVFKLNNADISPSFNGGSSSSGGSSGSGTTLNYEINGESYTTALPSLSFTYAGHTYNLLSSIGAFTSYLPVFKDFLRAIIIITALLGFWRSLPSIIGGVASVIGVSESGPIDDDAKYLSSSAYYTYLWTKKGG